MKKVIISGMIGNGLEWYDFAIYTYMVTVISKLFFPEGNEQAHLLATFAIYAVGFVARPFGGVLFGWIGDKFGRRNALVISIFLMALPTGLIGMLPTYAQVGMIAPWLLVCLRVLQGLSLGGAFSGSITFLVEHSPPGKRGLVGSASIVSLAFGFLLGSVIVMLVKFPITDMQFEEWGWRIPFLLGVPIGFIGLYIRNHCEESPCYEAAKKEGALSKTPLRDALTQEWKHVLQSIGIYMSVTMPFYLASAYFITFTEKTLGFSKDYALQLNFMVMMLLLVLAPISAGLSDRIGRRKLLLAAAFAFIVSAYPIFTLLLSKDAHSVFLAHLWFGILVGIYTPPVPTILVEIFPTRVRYTGMALSYNISAAAFGGTTPMVAQWLIQRTGDPYMIAYYVMLCAVISIIALFFYRDRYQEPLL